MGPTGGGVRPHPDDFDAEPRGAQNGLEAGIEAAFPLTDGSDPAADRDPRFSFTVGGRF